MKNPSGEVEENFGQQSEITITDANSVDRFNKNGEHAFIKWLNDSEYEKLISSMNRLFNDNRDQFIVRWEEFRFWRSHFRRWYNKNSYHVPNFFWDTTSDISTIADITKVSMQLPTRPAKVSSRTSISIKEALKQILEKDLKDKAKKHQTQSANVKNKAILLLKQKYSITITDNQLRTYLSRLDYTDPERSTHKSQ